MKRRLSVKEFYIEQTCSACPEQYNVYNQDDEYVGYLRLRHGIFRCDDASGNTVFSSYPRGDGCFDNDKERVKEINSALRALKEHMETNNVLEEPIYDYRYLDNDE